VYSCAGTQSAYRGADKTSVTDYADGGNWLALPAAADKKVDVFYIYPTAYYGDDPWCAADNADMRAEARGYRDTQASLFETEGNLYAPFYRQLGLSSEMKMMGEGMPIFDQSVKEVPLVDCKAAFEYFLQRHNEGKPIIFASHSQGTIIMRHLLLWIKDAHPDVLKRTIACYMIGFAINDDYCASVGIPFAEGESDTGVIISYNTESPGAAENPLLALPNPRAINPINWKRDDTYAPASESAGSRVQFDTGTPPVDKPHYADAQLNEQRGTVVTNAVVPSGGFWPAGVLHLYDYELFYYDLQANVSKRVSAYFAAHP
jgi:hypothetical protein